MCIRLNVSSTRHNFLLVELVLSPIRELLVTTEVNMSLLLHRLDYFVMLDIDVMTQESSQGRIVGCLPPLKDCMSKKSLCNRLRLL